MSLTILGQFLGLKRARSVESVITKVSSYGLFL